MVRLCGTRRMDLGRWALPSHPSSLPFFLNICWSVAESAYINVQLPRFAQNFNSYVTNTKIKTCTSTPESPQVPSSHHSPPGITIMRTSSCTDLTWVGVVAWCPIGFQLCSRLYSSRLGQNLRFRDFAALILKLTAACSGFVPKAAWASAKA